MAQETHAIHALKSIDRSTRKGRTVDQKHLFAHKDPITAIAHPWTHPREARAHAQAHGMKRATFIIYSCASQAVHRGETAAAHRSKAGPPEGTPTSAVVVVPPTLPRLVEMSGLSPVTPARSKRTFGPPCSGPTASTCFSQPTQSCR